MAVNLPPAPVLVWPFLVVWRKIWAAILRLPANRAKVQPFTLTIHAPSVAEEVDDAFDEDDMPLPALNVLLVEDIELNVIVARSVLEKLGNSVDVAMTGKAALEMFKPGEYDTVLLDIQLPDMTGLDISRELTKRYPREDLPPLVALTANVLKDKQKSTSMLEWMMC